MEVSLRLWLDFGVIILALDVVSRHSMIRDRWEDHGPLKAILFGVGIVLGNIFFIVGSVFLKLHLEKVEAVQQIDADDEQWKTVQTPLETVHKEHEACPTLWDHLMDDDE